MKHFKTHISLLFLLMLVFSFSFSSLAATLQEVDNLIEQIPNDWPEAPQISSEAAILVELNTDTILYAKNATQKMYPASTTKLMTALLTLENCNLDDIHTFTAAEVNYLPPGSSYIGVRPGESFTIRDCLYALLLPSANEVANGLAVQVAASEANFVDMMNAKAQELGCINTHFSNSNGLHDEEHYTCAYDLYLILQACLNYPDFIEISHSATYVRNADELSDRVYPMANTNNLVRPTTEYYYDKAVCGKTGWTEEAGRCLVTYATNDSSDLICVTMKTETPQQFIDTRTLFEYGFNEFSVVNAANRDTIYSGSSAADSLLNIPFKSIQLLQMTSNSLVLLPSTKDFAELETALTASGDGIYSLTYFLENYKLGSASLFAPEAVVKNPLKQEKTESVAITPADTKMLYSFSFWILLLPMIAILLVIFIVIFLLHHNSRKNRQKRKEIKRRPHLN